MAQYSYQTINLISDLVLSWPSSFAGGPVVYDFNYVIPSNNGLAIIMPDATVVPAVQVLVFNNTSIYSFNIIASDGITVITTVLAGEVIQLLLTGNLTANGTWDIIPFGGGTNAIVSITATSSDSSIGITNGAITPPGGVIDFQLFPSLVNLNEVVTTGFPVILTISPLTWTTRELLGGENIIITNGDGILDNPIIDVNPTITSLNSIQVGNLTLSGNIIDANNVNGGIGFSSNGTGTLDFNGVSIDTSGNVSGINNLTINGRYINSLMPKAYCSFTDTIVGLGNDITIESQVNVSSITGSAGTYVIHFTTPFIDTTYGILFGLGTTSGPLPFVSHIFYVLKEVDAVTISIVDASGQLVNAVPYGATVTIMSVN